MPLSDEQIEAGWVEHTGGPCPLDGETLVQIQLRNGHIFHTAQSAMSLPRWKHRKSVSGFDIIAYRSVK